MLSLKDFLKKYSTLNNDFLEQFLSFYDENTFPDDFVIDLDLVINWLEVDRRELKRTLLHSYRKKYDYIVNKTISNNKHGGHNKQIIMITPDCFKRICLMTKSKKGEMVRTYFISLEKLIIKYRKYIVDGLNKKIHELENNQKPYINTNKGIIYIFAADESQSLFKLGKTKNLTKRMNQHNSSHSNNIDVLFVSEVEDIDTVESCVKSLMKKHKYRKYKEVYEIDINVIKSLIVECSKMNQFTDYYSKKGLNINDYNESNLFAHIPKI